jgi:hypothetical protein
MKVVYGIQVGTFTASYQIGDGKEVPSGLVNITGLIQEGTNVTLTGNGTLESPYVVNATGGGASAWNDLTGTVDVIPFTASNGGPQNLGELAWDTSEETLSLRLKNQTTLQIGEETLYHVENATGSTITDGTPVAYAGTVGASGKIRVKPWNGSTDQPLAFMGLATGDIADGQTGYVTHFGKVRGINTIAFSPGAILYANPSGTGLTSTQPTSGDYVIAAVVVSAHATNGTLLVRPTKAIATRSGIDSRADFPPSAHKSTHATGGTDALTPADIGALATSDATTTATSNKILQRNSSGSGSLTSLTLSGGSGFVATFGSAVPLTANQSYWLPNATGYLVVTSNSSGVLAPHELAPLAIVTEAASFSVTQAAHGGKLTRLTATSGTTTITLPTTGVDNGTPFMFCRAGAGALAFDNPANVLGAAFLADVPVNGKFGLIFLSASNNYEFV